MHTLVTLLWIAGVLQILIAATNFVLPNMLRYSENLKRVEPFIRQVFIVHGAYIVGVLLLFAAVTLGFAPELSGGRGLGRFLSAGMGLFWLCRAPLQLFYYDRAVRRSHRVGDVLFVSSTLYLGLVYSVAAFAHVA